MQSGYVLYIIEEMHTIRPGGWGVYFLFDGRVGSLGGREQAVQANHSDEPPKAIIVSEMASTMI